MRPHDLRHPRTRVVPAALLACVVGGCGTESSDGPGPINAQQPTPDAGAPDVATDQTDPDADAQPVSDAGDAAIEKAADAADAADAAPDAHQTNLIDQPFRTDAVKLLQKVSQSGLTVEVYRNEAYTCGLSGYHSFAIAYPDGQPLAETHPLWVRFHGGGVGAYQPDGSYEPAEFFPGSLNEETGQELAGHLAETGLVAKILGLKKFRFLMPSMCDHDVYSGVGLPEPNNPHQPGENGMPRVADGLLAAKAAIRFALDRLGTSHVFFHGTSAGSAGVFSTAYAFERIGLRVNGIVADSGVIDRVMADIQTQVGQGGTCTRYEPLSQFQLVGNKIGPLVQDPWFSPAEVVRRGEMTVPIMHVWSHGDFQCCGDAVVTYVDGDAQAKSTGACDWDHEALRAAIEANNQGGRSENLRMCVDDPAKSKACDRHSPTIFDFTKNVPPGDTDHGGRDYNDYILKWVVDRLQKDPPAIPP